MLGLHQYSDIKPTGRLKDGNVSDGLISKNACVPHNTLLFIQATLATAGSSAVINTAINGGSLGDNLENAILTALVQTAHGAAASKIKNLDSQYIAHKVAHAVAGCAAAAANKGKCQDGAIGAAVGEIIGEHLLNGRNPDTLPLKEREQIIAYSRLVAGTAAGLAGGDVNMAADAAKVAVENNSLWLSKAAYDKDIENTKKAFQQTCGSMSVNQCFNQKGTEIRVEGMIGYIFQANGGISFLWIPGHTKLYKADAAVGLGYGGKLKFNQVDAAKELGISSSSLNKDFINEGSQPRNQTLGVSTKIEAEIRYWGLGGNASAEAGLEGKTNGQGDTTGFSNLNANIGYKLGSKGFSSLIKWDAFRFQWKR